MADDIRMNPDLMVVGDSLAQGVRSLSIDSAFAAHSYSAMAARHQRWKFVTPDFPRPPLLNLEDVLKRFSIPGLALEISRIQRNIREWEADFTGGGQSAHTCFDNLAIAGVTLDEFAERTSRSWRGRFLENSVPLRTALAQLDLKAVGDHAAECHLGANGGFVLNPKGTPQLSGLTAMAWVRRRKPKRLIFHVGHNNGLYEVGSSAKKAELERTTWPKFRDQLEALDSLPRAIETIVVVLFPRVGAVANLMPEIESGRIDERYWSEYGTVFPAPDLAMDGETLRDIDAQIGRINGKAQTLIGGLSTASRFRIVDAYRILSRHDYKNLLSDAARVDVGGFRTDNRYIKPKRRLHRRGPRGRGRAPRYRYYFNEVGALQSADGMHPTAIGYALIAKEIMRALRLPYDEARLVRDALDSENLVSSPRRQNRFLEGLDEMLDILRLAGRLGMDRTGEPAAAPRAAAEQRDSARKAAALAICAGGGFGR